MAMQTQNVSKKNIVIGLLAHVDAGKTTLSEALLYQGGAIRKAGSVDEGHLIIFDRSKEKTWEERIWHRPCSYQGKTIMPWGCNRIAPICYAMTIICVVQPTVPYPLHRTTIPIPYFISKL